jgi:hypothetical protein
LIRIMKGAREKPVLRCPHKRAVSGEIDDQLLKRWLTDEFVDGFKNMFDVDRTSIVDQKFDVNSLGVEPVSYLLGTGHGRVKRWQTVRLIDTNNNRRPRYGRDRLAEHTTTPKRRRQRSAQPEKITTPHDKQS